MYEAVTAHPDGDSTVSRFAAAAARYGYDGLVVRARGSLSDAEREGYERAAERFDVDVVDAVEIDADTPEGAAGALGNYRRKRTLVCVRGGTPRMNRFAVEHDRVDVLTRPLSGDGDVNHVLAKAARDHGVRLEFDFGPVLRRDGGTRVQALRKLRKLRELVAQYDAPSVVSARPTSHLRVRSPRELRALGGEIGFDADTIDEGLREWGRLAARNRHRLSESFIGLGVERGRYEEDAR